MPRKAEKNNEIDDAKEQIRQIFGRLEFDQVIELKSWIEEYIANTPKEEVTFNLEKEKMKKVMDKAEKKLNKVAKHLAEQAVDLPSKEPTKLRYPTEGLDSDCNELNTCEVDAFLYEDDDIESLVEHGMMSRSYCPKCCTRDTEQLNFISHSLSRPQVRFIFTSLLPPTVRNVLDIGSRIGAIVYGSSIFTNGNVKTVGVEMNPEYVKLAQKTIRQFALKNIELITEDIRHVPNVFKEDQMIVMNNVFSFFLSKTEQEECWEFLYKNMLPGTVLIHHPPIGKVLGHLDLSFETSKWLKPVDTSAECEAFAGDDLELFQEMMSLVKYTVLPKEQ